MLSLPWLCESYGFTKKTWLPLQFQAGLAIGSACNTHRFPRRSSARKIMVRSCWILADSRSKLGLTRCKKSNFFYRGIPIDPSGEQSMSRMPRMSRCCCVVNTMCLRSSEAQDKICSIFTPGNREPARLVGVLVERSYHDLPRRTSARKKRHWPGMSDECLPPWLSFLCLFFWNIANNTTKIRDARTVGVSKTLCISMGE